MFNSVAPRVLAAFNPADSASYSASLLVVVYCRHMARFMTSPSGDLIIIPTPPSFLVDELSVWTVHLGALFSTVSACSSFLLVNSAMKSANACALMADRDR